jgi:uncharacterized repeat protein (TIGR04076 family)
LIAEQEEVDMTAVRITVLKRALHADLAKELSGSEVKPCEIFHDGQTFIAGFTMPEGFCGWAWTDISRMVLALHAGGHFDRGMFNNWMKADNTAISCCTDGFRPVTFKLERVETKSLIDLSGIERPAPREVYDSERWGECSCAIPGLTPGAGYRIRLHFCEIYFSGRGKRRFSVEANGRRLLDDFDIFAEAGGGYKPVIREFDVAADKKGELILGFIKGQAESPKINAIEILLPSGGKPIHAINAGGPACGAFAADQFFTGGNVAGG